MQAAKRELRLRTKNEIRASGVMAVKMSRHPYETNRMYEFSFKLPTNGLIKNKDSE